MKTSEFVGRTLLLGIDLSEKEGEVQDRIQVFGRLQSIHPDRNFAVLLRLNGAGSKTLSIPFTPKHWHPAKPGRYQLHSTGEVVEDPDFVSTCTLTVGPGRTIQEARQHWLGTEGPLPHDGTPIQ